MSTFLQIKVNYKSDKNKEKEIQGKRNTRKLLNKLNKLKKEPNEEFL